MPQHAAKRPLHTRQTAITVEKHPPNLSLHGHKNVDHPSAMASKICSFSSSSNPMSPLSPDSSAAQTTIEGILGVNLFQNSTWGKSAVFSTVYTVGTSLCSTTATLFWGTFKSNAAGSQGRPPRRVRPRTGALLNAGAEPHKLC